MTIDGELSPDHSRIMGELLIEWQALFLKKARGYGSMHRDLGVKAQYVDLHRKTMKMRAALWDGADTSDWHEGPREIAMDLIGHLFLTIALLDREERGADPIANGLTFSCSAGNCSEGHIYALGCILAGKAPR